MQTTKPKISEISGEKSNKTKIPGKIFAKFANTSKDYPLFQKL